MLLVPEPEARGHSIVAGPLRARLSDDAVLRVGWDEPDWLGPATLQVPGRPVSPLVGSDGSRSLMYVGFDWIASQISTRPGEPVIIMTLEVSEARRGIGTGD